MKRGFADGRVALLSTRLLLPKNNHGGYRLKRMTVVVGKPAPVSGKSRKLVHAAGFEPAECELQDADNQSASETRVEGYTQISAQISDPDSQMLARVVESWPQLGRGLKLAILAIVDAESREGGIG